jgi:transcriptional regulator with XRE-family HTH domain
VLKPTRLRELRERASYSQMELAERSGISRATIADLESGKRGARPKTRRKLAKALGVEPWELVSDVQGGIRVE